MPGWYDIVRPRDTTHVRILASAAWLFCTNTLPFIQLSLDDISQREDEPGIIKSKDYIHTLIAKEIEKGIPSERIVLGGFSQGGAMSIFSGLTCPTRLGGIFGLSCYLLLQGKIKDMVPVENPNKVYWRHASISGSG